MNKMHRQLTKQHGAGALAAFAILAIALPAAANPNYSDIASMTGGGSQAVYKNYHALEVGGGTQDFNSLPNLGGKGWEMYGNVDTGGGGGSGGGGSSGGGGPSGGGAEKESYDNSYAVLDNISNNQLQEYNLANHSFPGGSDSNAPIKSAGAPIPAGSSLYDSGTTGGDGEYGFGSGIYSGGGGYAWAGLTSMCKDMVNIPGNTEPSITPGSAMSMLCTFAAGVKNLTNTVVPPQLRTKSVAGGLAAAIQGKAKGQEAKQNSTPGQNAGQAKSNQNAEKSQGADNLALMERYHAAAAIEFVENYVENFTTQGGNKWNRIRNQLFLPMALLLLLPGAILAQMKSTVAAGFPVLGEATPFEGIFRSIVAIFLIPATYLVVNYGIDVANSLTKTIADGYQQVFGTNMYEDAFCGHVRAFPVREPDENMGQIVNQHTVMFNYFGTTPIARLEGKTLAIKYFDPCAGIYIVPPDRANEVVPYLVNEQRMAWNQANAALTMGWTILCCVQQAYLYYLFLVGPIMAALWVYPSKQLRDAFPSWIEGVVVVCFWSFFWSTSILLMAICRGVDDTGTVMFTALNTLVIASAKFAFDFVGMTKEMGQQAMRVAEKAAQAMAAASKQGGGGGGSGGGGHGGGKSSKGGDTEKKEHPQGGPTAPPAQAPETVKNAPSFVPGFDPTASEERSIAAGNPAIGSPTADMRGDVSPIPKHTTPPPGSHFMATVVPNIASLGALGITPSLPPFSTPGAFSSESNWTMGGLSDNFALNQTEAFIRAGVNTPLGGNDTPEAQAARTKLADEIQHQQAKDVEKAMQEMAAARLRAADADQPTREALAKQQQQEMAQLLTAQNQQFNQAMMQGLTAEQQGKLEQQLKADEQRRGEQVMDAFNKQLAKESLAAGMSWDQHHHYVDGDTHITALNGGGTGSGGAGGVGTGASGSGGLPPTTQAYAAASLTGDVSGLPPMSRNDVSPLNVDTSGIGQVQGQLPGQTFTNDTVVTSYNTPITGTGAGGGTLGLPPDTMMARDSNNALAGEVSRVAGDIASGATGITQGTGAWTDATLRQNIEGARTVDPATGQFTTNVPGGTIDGGTRIVDGGTLPAGSAGGMTVADAGGATRDESLNLGRQVGDKAYDLFKANEERFYQTGEARARDTVGDPVTNPYERLTGTPMAAGGGSGTDSLPSQPQQPVQPAGSTGSSDWTIERTFARDSATNAEAGSNAAGTPTANSEQVDRIASEIAGAATGITQGTGAWSDSTLRQNIEGSRSADPATGQFISRSTDVPAGQFDTTQQGGIIPGGGGNAGDTARGGGTAPTVDASGRIVSPASAETGDSLGKRVGDKAYDLFKTNEERFYQTGEAIGRNSVGDPVTNPYEQLTGTPHIQNTETAYTSGNSASSTDASGYTANLPGGSMQPADSAGRGNTEMTQFVEKWAGDLTGIDSQGRMQGGFDADASINRKVDSTDAFARTDYAKPALDPSLFAINRTQGPIPTSQPPVMVPTQEVRSYLIGKLNKASRPGATGPGAASVPGKRQSADLRPAPGKQIKQPPAKPTVAPPAQTTAPTGSTPPPKQAPIGDWTSHLASETLKRRARTAQKRSAAESQAEFEKLRNMQQPKPDGGEWTV